MNYFKLKDIPFTIFKTDGHFVWYYKHRVKWGMSACYYASILRAKPELIEHITEAEAFLELL